MMFFIVLFLHFFTLFQILKCIAAQIFNFAMLQILKGNVTFFEAI